MSRCHSVGGRAVCGCLYTSASPSRGAEKRNHNGNVNLPSGRDRLPRDGDRESHKHRCAASGNQDCDATDFFFVACIFPSPAPGRSGRDDTIFSPLERLLPRTGGGAHASEDKLRIRRSSSFRCCQSDVIITRV